MVDVRLQVSREMPMPCGAVYHDRFDVSHAIGEDWRAISHARIRGRIMGMLRVAV